MKVCYVADVGTKVSGGHQSLLNLMEDLGKMGVEPFLVCHKEWELTNIAREKKIPVKVIPAKIYTAVRLKVSLKDYIKYPLKRMFNQLNFKAKKDYLKDNGIELVHLNSLLASEQWAKAAFECNIPYVWHIREFMDRDHGRVIINEEYSYKWVRNANEVITISKSVQNYWEKKLGRPCAMIYNGLPWDKYQGNVKDKFESEIIRSLIVGRVVEGKGQIDAVKAVELLNEQGITNIHLTLVGYRGLTEYEKEIKKYIEEQDLSKLIEMVDFTYELQAIRQQSDIGITTSKAEAFGRVTIENMLGGLLAIGTKSGGTAELIEDGLTGFLYKPGNYVMLADILKSVIQNVEEMKKIAQDGQQNARQNYLIERTVEAVYKVYESQLHGR